MRRRAIIGKSKGGVLTPGTGFKMQIQTTTANQTFTLPTQSGYTYNATVLWGDGTYSQVTGHNVNNAKTYATAGTYDIEIKGTFDSIYFNNAGSNLLVKKILSWGGSDFQGFTVMNNAFMGCSNLNELAVGGIKEKSGSSITSFNYTFNSCYALTTLPADLFRYNTAVTTFIQTFFSCSSLTTLPANLFQYNTAVTNFSNTFYGCNKLQLRSDIFGATPNFGTKVMNFNNCFNRATFTGTQGTAPALWSATMNASSTKTSCFGGAGNNDSSIQNYTALKAANPSWF